MRFMEGVDESLTSVTTEALTCTWGQLQLRVDDR